jgi:hypothetical protein
MDRRRRNGAPRARTSLPLVAIHHLDGFVVSPAAKASLTERMVDAAKGFIGIVTTNSDGKQASFNRLRGDVKGTVNTVNCVCITRTLHTAVLL